MTNFIHIDFPLEDEEVSTNWKSCFDQVLSYSNTYTGCEIIKNICQLLRQAKDQNISMEESFLFIIQNEAVIYNLLGKKRDSKHVLYWHRCIISYCVSIVYKEEYRTRFPHFFRYDVEKVIF